MGFVNKKANPRAKRHHTYKLMPGEDTVTADQVRRCKYCGADITFLEGASGKFYAVNVPGQVSNAGNLIIRRNNFHSKTCEVRNDTKIT